MFLILSLRTCRTVIIITLLAILISADKKKKEIGDKTSLL